MQNIYPTLFISHGAPDIVTSNHQAVNALTLLGQRFAAPRAIIIVSAHWISTPIGITSAEKPSTIHDFGGFPKSLYKLNYPAKGDPLLAEEIGNQLTNSGFKVNLDDQRGFDHGTWVPLMLMYPNADIPVIQVSLPEGDIEACIRLGESLAVLRKQGILVIGSGGSVHNLRALNIDGITAEWATSFENWLLNAVEGNHFNQVTNPAEFPPEFIMAHPTIEHFMPLIVAWAAANRERAGKRIYHGFMYGNNGLSFYQFN